MDKKIYHAYLKDLNDIGYNFSSFCNTKRNTFSNSIYLKIKSEFKLYIPSSLFIIKKSAILALKNYAFNIIITTIFLFLTLTSIIILCSYEID